MAEGQVMTDQPSAWPPTEEESEKLRDIAARLYRLWLESLEDATDEDDPSQGRPSCPRKDLAHKDGAP